MPRKNKCAVSLGRKGGKATARKKKAAKRKISKIKKHAKRK